MKSLFWCFVTLVLASEPLVYPLSQESLVKCSEPYLCRPQRQYDADELEWISQLSITDPLFYDVFTKEEIFRLFKPVRNRKPVPFYIWTPTRNTKEVAYETPIWHMDSWTAFYVDALQSTWRTYDPKAAIIHYFASPLAPTQGDRAPIRLGPLDEGKLAAMDTEEFHATNGSNFFYVSTSYVPALQTIGKSGGFFKALLAHKTPNVSSRLFANSAISMHYTLFPAIIPCMMMTDFTAFDAARGLAYWPTGQLESYKYPLGRWQQMLNSRKIKWTFNGQIDGRWAYDTRREFFLHDVKPFCDDGAVISRIAKGPQEIPLCPNRLLPGGDLPEMCVCYDLTRYRSIPFEEVLTQSLFAFHIRGDNYYSSRIADIYAAGPIPIIIDYNMLMGVSGQCHNPSKDMAIYIPLEDWHEDPVNATMKAVSKKSHNDLEKMVRLLQYYRGSLVSGAYGDNRVVEDRLSHMVTRCLSEDLLRSMNFTKSDMTCDFEDNSNAQAFPTTGDLDDIEPPWGAHFVGQT